LVQLGPSWRLQSVSGVADASGVTVPTPLHARLQPAVSSSPVVRIACVGDSITFGLWASSTGMSYPKQLQRMLGPAYLVMNFGESGRTVTAGTQNRMSYWESPRFNESLSSAPDIVVIMLGTNDAAKGIWCDRLRQFVPSYGHLIRTYLQLNSKPRVFVAEPPPMYDGSSYSAWFFPAVVNGVFPDLLPQIVCGEVIRLHTVFASRCPLNRPSESQACDLMNSDGVHPTDHGYCVIAQVVGASIVQQPAVPGPLPATASRKQCQQKAMLITGTRGVQAAAGVCV